VNPDHLASPLDIILYRLYSLVSNLDRARPTMKPANKHGAEQARRLFPTLVERAARGEPTIITKHGKPYAALVPAAALERNGAHVDIRALRGTGKGLWGRSIRRAIQSMRDEWR